MFDRIRAQHPRWTGALVSLAIALSVFIVYYLSLFNDFVALDDSLLLVNNPNVHALTWATLKTIFTSYDPELYIPLTLLSYQLQYIAFGLHPFAYHLVNVALHALSAVLFSVIATTLTKNRLTGFIAGMLFGLHPLNVEAVAWVAARKDLLSTLFFLAAFVLYLRYATHKRIRDYVASILLFLLGLLAKVTIVILPFVQLLTDWYSGRNMRSWTVYREKIPYFLLSAIFIVVALVGKAQLLKIANLLPSEYVGISVQSTVFAASKVVLPINLSVAYPLLGTIEFFSLPSLLALALVFFLGGLCVIQYVRYGRKMPLFAYVFFLLSYAQAAVNLVKGADLYLSSDRYAYIAQMGVLMLIASMLSSLWNTRHARVLTALFFGSLLVLLGTMTLRQSLVWANTDLLFDHANAIYPQSPLVHRARGMLAVKRGDFIGGVQNYLGSPDASPGPFELSMAGQMLYNKGDSAQARHIFESILSSYPEYGIAHDGLARILNDEGSYDEALTHYREALKSSNILIGRQYRVGIYNNIAAIYAKKGLHMAEIEHYKKALELDPTFAYGYYNLAAAYAEIGESANAIRSYEKAIALLPSFTSSRLNYARLLYSLGRKDDAIAELQEIKRVNPKETEAQLILSKITGSE